MGIITNRVEIKPRGAMIKYYQDKGYDAHYNQSIVVNVGDLPEKSNVYLNILCDICKENTMSVRYADYNRVVKKTGNYACKDCSCIKAQQTNIAKYGKSYYFQTQEFSDKFKSTMLNHYGVDNPLKSEQIMNKIRNTNLQKYGHENPNQVPEFKEKAKQTMLERFGVDNASKNEEVKAKIRNTNLQKYGVLYTQQSLEVRAKSNETLCKNGSQKTSKQQLYLHSLYGGKLNFAVKYYATDICFPEEKLTIEYDGGGHDLRVTLGILTQEEFDQKEIVRSNIIKREGYKQMHIVSIEDLLPSDATLLQMLNDTRNYFSFYPQHSWIEFNIDTSTVRNAEHKDGVPYDYGVLRTIKCRF